MGGSCAWTEEGHASAVQAYENSGVVRQEFSEFWEECRSRGYGINGFCFKLKEVPGDLRAVVEPSLITS